jgi:ribosomal protein L6P/L9E
MSWIGGAILRMFSIKIRPLQTTNKFKQGPVFILLKILGKLRYFKGNKGKTTRHLNNSYIKMSSHNSKVVFFSWWF